jgi:glycerol-3-phosphate dehydrogenase subunit B
MMQRHVVVLGSGAAGTAAALAASQAGARVTVVRGGVGATSLTSGALGERQDPRVDDIKAATDALDIYALGACTLATSAGTLRSASGRDRGLCDLSTSQGAVLIARVAHPAWDADALAASYGELDETRRYVVRDVGLVIHPGERAMTHTELAALHDDDARLATAAERIQTALADGGPFGAVLLPPWLGVMGPRAAALSKLVGAPCGEVLAAFDGPCGARFERARDRVFGAFEVVQGRARRIVGHSVEVGTAKLEADAIVLATGGLLGGGIAYTPGDAAPARATPAPARAAFALTYDAPVALGHEGRPLMVPGSIFGIQPEALVWPYEESPMSERIGVLAREGLRAGDGIYVAGDALADAPRTLLAAFASGTAAGRAAAAG